MKWNGFELSLAPDCEHDEDALGEVSIEDAEEVESYFGEALPTGLRFTKQVEDGGVSEWLEIVDQVLLGSWIERRLGPDEWSALHTEREEQAQDEADDAGETLMRDRAAGVA